MSKAPTKRILVLDDQDGLRKLLFHILRQKYQVAIGGNGMEGMLWLMQGNLPDLILLDLGMPILSGLDFLWNIRQSAYFRHIPVIILSSESNPDSRRHCGELGIAAFFTKPFDPLELLEQIRIVIH